MKSTAINLTLAMPTRGEVTLTVNGKPVGHQFALELGTLLIEAGKQGLPRPTARGILVEAQDLARRVKVTNLMPAKE